MKNPITVIRNTGLFQKLFLAFVLVMLIPIFISYWFSQKSTTRVVINRVFEMADRAWRGIGVIPLSGYRLREEFAAYDAEKRFPGIQAIETHESPLCISGLVLQGRKKPLDCPAFGKQCTPQTPLGATMVSSEGACAAYYRYRRSGRVTP